MRLPLPPRDVRPRDGSEAAQAERKMREALEERFRAGFEAGEKSLREELLRQRAQLLELQNGVLRSLERALPSVISECEKSVVLLALEAARRVVQGIPISPELVENTVRAALDELRETTEYRVFLNPEDLALLESVQSGILPSPATPQARFEADPGIARGDCRVETRHGSIEAAREKMFQSIQRAVLC